MSSFWRGYPSHIDRREDRETAHGPPFLRLGESPRSPAELLFNTHTTFLFN